MSKLRVLAVGFGVVALTLALHGCGGRTARPVTVTQSFDTDMSCAQLASEIEANKVRMNSLHKEDADRHGRNAAMATAGVLLIGLPALNLIDDGSAQETEIHAYTARNNHLTQVASTKGCTDEEMAAAVAANSAYAAAAATGTTAKAGATQVATATGPKTKDAAAQAQFDAWYATNNEALRRAITAETREENLLASCIAGLRPTEPVVIEDATVVSRDENGYRLNVAYYKASESSCNGTRNDAFLIRIENDQIAEVSYVGPASSAPVTAAVPAGATAASSGQASDLAAAQAKFDAWYAANGTLFADRMNDYAHQEGLVTNNCSVGRAKVTDTTVTGERDGGYLVNITIWKQSSSTNCEVVRTDSYFVGIENDQLATIEHIGPAGGSAAASSQTKLAAAQAQFDPGTPATAPSSSNS